MSLDKEKSSRDIEAQDSNDHVVTDVKAETNADQSQLNPSDNVNAENTDHFVVSWEEPEDQDVTKPLNWPSSRKWTIIALLSFTTFLTPLASSMFAPGVPIIMVELKNTSNLFATFCVSIFVLGFAAGPLVLAPLSEIYGRVIVYNVCNVLFFIFTVLCAIAKDSGMLLAARFWAGFAGVATITCGSSTIADMMPKETRASAMSVWAAGPLLGPVIGPVIGGAIIQNVNWRWVFWIITILAGLVTVLAFFLLRETYGPIILERKAARLRKERNDERYRSKFETNETPRQKIRNAVTRPLAMLLFSPIVSVMSVYIAVTYGIMYILFTTFSFVFGQIYHFSELQTGLTFLGSGIGNLIGLAYSGRLSDWYIRRKISNGQATQPEDRLALIITVPASICLPVGLFLYGWTVQMEVHWIAPMIGTTIMGFGMICLFMVVQTYLVDCFSRHAASAVAANAVLRSISGALLPLCALDIYDALGYGWGNTLFAFVLLAMAPIPWLLRLYGDRLRKNVKE